MGANCFKCSQRIIGRNFVLDGHSYCGACYSSLLEERKKKEEEATRFVNYLNKLNSFWPLSTLSITKQINYLVNEYEVDELIKIVNYYYNILNNSISYQDIFSLKELIEGARASYQEYLSEQDKIKQINEKVDLNVPAQNIKIHINKNKKRQKMPDYNMEDL